MAQRPRRASAHLSLGAFFFLVGLSGLTLAAGIGLDSQRGLAIFVLIELALIAVALFRLNLQGRPDPFAPTGFPLVYTIFTITAGTVVAATVGFDSSFLAADLITERLLIVQLVFCLGLFAGVIFAGSPRALTVEHHEPRPSPGSNTLLISGAYVILALSAGYRVWRLVTFGPGSWNSSRGVDFTFTSQLALLSSLMPLVAVMMALLAGQQRHHLSVPRGLLALLAVWVLASLAIGSRDEVVAPVIVLLWAYHHRVKPLRGGVVLAMMIGGIALLGAVGVLRQGDSVKELTVAELVRPTASGVNTTALAVRYIPRESPYVGGDTYVAALKASVPFGKVDANPDHATASLRLPSVVHFTAESGLGFSPVGEAYWNFGLLGCALVPFGFGIFLVVAYRFSNPWPTNPMHLLYPLLVARLPIELRSDFLQQFKGVAMTLLAVTVIWVCQKASDSATHRHEHPAQPSAATAMALPASQRPSAPSLRSHLDDGGFHG